MTLEKIILEILESRDTTNQTEVRRYCLDGYGLRISKETAFIELQNMVNRGVLDKVNGEYQKAI